MPTYLSLLAAGVTAEGTFDPAELYAGEADIITDRGVCGTSTITVLQPVARDEDGLIVPWSSLTGAASKAGTFSGVGTAADTITVNLVAFTLATAAANAHEVTIGGTATATAVNFAAAVNADPDGTHVRAVQAGAVVTLYALEAGYGGNNIAIAESSTSFSFAGGATALSGGTAEGENRAIGIAAQTATVGEGIPYFTGGVFNVDLIVWPTEIDTLAKRKAVFDRTNISVSKLVGVSTNMVIP